jgi:hypothetical protein
VAPDKVPVLAFLWALRWRHPAAAKKRKAKRRLGEKKPVGGLDPLKNILKFGRDHELEVMNEPKASVKVIEVVW